RARHAPAQGRDQWSDGWRARARDGRGGMSGSSSEADLIVVGAGAKAAAIATKVHVLNRLGLGPIALTIVEASEPAASWSGRHGQNPGGGAPGDPPIKDGGGAGSD